MLYERVDENYINTLFDNDNSSDYHSHVIEFLEKYAIKENRILDIGTGTGGLIKKLKEKGYKNCFGIDLDKRFIEAGRKKHNLDDYIFTLDEFSGNEKKFDIVISFTVIEHVDDVEGFLDFKLKFLKSDGIFYLFTPNYHNPKLYLKFILSKFIGKKLHLTPFSKGNIFYSIFMFFKISFYSIIKLITKKVMILKVNPIPSEISLGGDADACWCSNYLDIKN